MKRSLENLDDAIIVALGSNLAGEFESSQALLEAAVEALDGEGLKVVARSSWWRSKAWPDASDPEFLNGVAIVETGMQAAGVLAALHRLETEFGRKRQATNAPRPLDLDLVAYGRTLSVEPALPHPRAHERRFVMGPLAEIAPDWSHPRSGVTASTLARTSRVGEDATPIAGGPFKGGAMTDARGTGKKSGPFSGRLGRKGFWIAAACLAVAQLSVMQLLPTGRSALTFVWFFLAVLRLHDIGRTGWWAGGVLIANFVIGVILGVFVSGMGQAALGMGVTLISLVDLALIVWLGCQKGDPGENRFGPAPGKQSVAEVFD